MILRVKDTLCKKGRKNCAQKNSKGIGEQVQPIKIPSRNARLKHFQDTSQEKSNCQTPPRPHLVPRASQAEGKSQNRLGSYVQHTIRQRKKQDRQFFPGLERKKRHHGCPEGGRGVPSIFPKIVRHQPRPCTPQPSSIPCGQRRRSDAL